MLLIILRIAIDFGLLVLIWMIQLIVYPSFKYYTTENLIRWHQKYTGIIGTIVAPLMLMQLTIAGYQIIAACSGYYLLYLLLIVMLWAITFLQFVPMHTKISKGVVNQKLLASLVKKNWLRTLLWSIVCLLSIGYYVFLGI